MYRIHNYFCKKKYLKCHLKFRFKIIERDCTHYLTITTKNTKNNNFSLYDNVPWHSITQVRTRNYKRNNIKSIRYLLRKCRLIIVIDTYKDYKDIFAL